MRLQQRLGDLAALVAGEIAGLAGEDDHLGRLGLDRVVEALLAVVGGRRADRALELDDLALAAGLGLIVQSATRWPSWMKFEPMKAR